MVHSIAPNTKNINNQPNTAMMTTDIIENNSEGLDSASHEEIILDEPKQAEVIVKDEPRRGSWYEWLPTYGNYGGGDYSAGRRGGDPSSADAPLPIDALDELFRLHDLDYARLADKAGELSPADFDKQLHDSDTALVSGIVKLLGDPAFRANNPGGLAYGTAAAALFAAKALLCDAGYCGVGSVKRDTAGRVIEVQAEPKAQEKRVGASKALAGLWTQIKPAVEQFTVMAPTKQHARYGPPKEKPVRNAFVWWLRSLLPRANIDLLNPGPANFDLTQLKSRLEEAVVLAGRIRDMSADDKRGQAAVVEGTLRRLLTTLRTRGVWVRDLTADGDVESNPGPSLDDLTEQLRKDLDDAVEYLRSADGTVQTDRDGGDYMDMMYTKTIAMRTSSANTVVISACPPVGHSHDRTMIYQGNAAAGSSETIGFFMNSGVAGPGTRRLQPDVSLAQMVTDMQTATSSTAMADIWSVWRTNPGRISGEQRMVYFSSCVPSLLNAKQGSCASHLAKLMAIICTASHYDPLANIIGPKNVFPRDQNLVAAYDPRDAVVPGLSSDASGAYYEIWPMSPAANTAAVSTRVRAYYCSFATYLKMKLGDVASTSVIGSSHWGDQDVAIIPVSPDEPISNGSYMAALTLAHMRHPFVVPVVTVTDHTDSRGLEYNAQGYLTNSAYFHAIDGPRALTTTGALNVLYVVCGTGTDETWCSQLYLNVGAVNVGAAASYVPPTGVVGAGTNVGAGIYNMFLVANVRSLSLAARNVYSRYIRRGLASPDDLRQAIAWFAGGSVRLPFAINANTEVVNTGATTYCTPFGGGVPAFATTNMTECTSSALMRASAQATNAFGQLWAKFSNPANYGTSTNPYVMRSNFGVPMHEADMGILLSWINPYPGEQLEITGMLADPNPFKLQMLQVEWGARLALVFDAMVENLGLPGDIWAGSAGAATQQGYYNFRARLFYNQRVAAAFGGYQLIDTINAVTAYSSDLPGSGNMTLVTVPNRIPVWMRKWDTPLIGGNVGIPLPKQKATSVVRAADGLAAGTLGFAIDEGVKAGRGGYDDSVVPGIRAIAMSENLFSALSFSSMWMIDPNGIMSSPVTFAFSWPYIVASVMTAMGRNNLIAQTNFDWAVSIGNQQANSVPGYNAEDGTIFSLRLATYVGNARFMGQAIVPTRWINPIEVGVHSLTDYTLSGVLGMNTLGDILAALDSEVAQVQNRLDAGRRTGGKDVSPDGESFLASAEGGAKGGANA